MFFIGDTLSPKEFVTVPSGIDFPCKAKPGTSLKALRSLAVNKHRIDYEKNL